MTISNDRKTVALATLNAFAKEPKIFQYWDDANVNSVDILISENSPFEGINSYSTLGLCEHDVGLSYNDIPLRIEFVGACYKRYENFANISATCAFNIINSNLSCQFGTVFENVISLYYPEFEMKHALFLSPFLWDYKLENLDLSDSKLAWLMIVPISDNEYDYMQEHGLDKLEELLDKGQIDAFDLERKSIL